MIKYVNILQLFIVISIDSVVQASPLDKPSELADVLPLLPPPPILLWKCALLPAISSAPLPWRKGEVPWIIDTNFFQTIDKIWANNTFPSNNR